MPDQLKPFPTLVVASASSGVGLAERLRFSDIQEVAEWVLGYSVWTHELADKALCEMLTAAIRRQLPDMPGADIEGLDAGGWIALGLAAVERYGEIVSLKRGDGQRGESPLASLQRLAPDAAITVVEVPDDH